MSGKLIENYIGEVVRIVTDVLITSYTEDGAAEELPMGYEGMLIDVDEDNMLIQVVDGTTTKLINKSKMVTIELLDEVDTLEDVPEKQEMN